MLFTQLEPPSLFVVYAVISTRRLITIKVFCICFCCGLVPISVNFLRQVLIKISFWVYNCLFCSCFWLCKSFSLFLHLFCCTVHNIGQIPHQLFVLADILPGELECFLIYFECLVGLKINYKIPFSYARIRHPYYDRQWPRQRAFRHQSASQSWATILVEANPVTILSTTWNAGEHLSAYLIGSRLHKGLNGCPTGSLGFTALTITLKPASGNSGLS